MSTASDIRLTYAACGASEGSEAEVELQLTVRIERRASPSRYARRRHVAVVSISDRPRPLVGKVQCCTSGIKSFLEKEEIVCDSKQIEATENKSQAREEPSPVSAFDENHVDMAVCTQDRDL
jgi:hypothetical protein